MGESSRLWEPWKKKKKKKGNLDVMVSKGKEI